MATHSDITVGEEFGGGPACYLDRVCDNCGRIFENEFAAVCEHCGAARYDDRPAGEPKSATHAPTCAQ